MLQALLATVLRWLLRHLLSLVLIVAVLLLGRAAWVEWQAWQSTRAELALLGRAEREIRDSLQALAGQIQARSAGLQSATLAALESRVAAVDSDIARKQLERQAFSGLAPIMAGHSIAQAQVQALRIDAAIALLQQERDWLQDAKLHLLASQSAQVQRTELERLRQRHVELYRQWGSAVQEHEAFARQHPIRSRLPGTIEFRWSQALDERRAQRLAEVRRADADYRRQQALMDRAPVLPPRAPSALPPGAVDQALQPLRQRLAQLTSRAEENRIGRIWRPVQEVLPTALLILLGIILAPIAIKALFYFVLAPLAARRPPIQLLPHKGGLVRLEGATSSVSRAVTIDAASELLIHPEFLQSASVGGEKSTQWLLNRRFALTSLSAGMVALTRIRCEVPETFVISATRNPLAEIGVLDLAAGSALVMQPHNLVGVIQPRATPLHITAHWRLNSLHAWLTLQLRYLALHGPARLIVLGGRGVRLEPATGGRAISQSATIAFSANVAYSTRRCETFAAYLLGRQALLSDCFGAPGSAGTAQGSEAGVFIYEELPHAGRAAGVTGRGLAGLSESLMKVLGI